ncbi:MAG: hypothetical protein LBH01_06660 [Verrucomicrobiales bacterium]|jgi:hypothetical protein|nr:hypothetical protein [Verrucomicrobiales bacterium]
MQARLERAVVAEKIKWSEMADANLNRDNSSDQIHEIVINKDKPTLKIPLGVIDVFDSTSGKSKITTKYFGVAGEVKYQDLPNSFLTIDTSFVSPAGNKSGRGGFGGRLGGLDTDLNGAGDWKEFFISFDKDTQTSSFNDADQLKKVVLNLETKEFAPVSGRLYFKNVRLLQFPYMSQQSPLDWTVMSPFYQSIDRLISMVYQWWSIDRILWVALPYAFFCCLSTIIGRISLRKGKYWNEVFTIFFVIDALVTLLGLVAYASGQSIWIYGLLLLYGIGALTAHAIVFKLSFKLYCKQELRRMQSLDI